MAVSRNLGGKVPLVEDLLSSYEQEVYPNTSHLKLLRVWIPNGLDLIPWFMTEVLGSEIEISQGSWERNLQHQKGKKGAQRRK